MTIYVKKSDGGGLEVVTGQQRLTALLEMQGKALVMNMATCEQLEVHEVGGKLLALTTEASDAVHSAVEAVIWHAARR
jgi:hypothetical protein